MKCKRCGNCCENIALAMSPKEFKKHYMDWVNEVKDRRKVSEIHLLYPMMKYKGYDRKVKRYRYICRFLEVKNGLKTCGIQDIKPEMCRQYGVPEKLKMGVEGSLNQKLYPNCVF